MIAQEEIVRETHVVRGDLSQNELPRVASPRVFSPLRNITSIQYQNPIQ